MCGIAGEINFKGEITRELSVASMSHRGPDGTGTWKSSNGKIWFGHNRLSIVDLSPTGNQPMVDPETGNCLVFNGEIYNNFQLREELKANGFAFKGTSDTESLLLGYRLWGEAMLERLKGMFAFALYDASRQSVWLARDRFGIKPLYYYEKPGESFSFASEVRWLIAQLPAIAPPNTHTLASYLQFGACPHHTLLYPEIKDFPVASSRWILRKGGGVTRGYFFPKSPLSTRISFAEAARKVRGLLETSVREHLMADVPVATLLSGGIDSSIITALAARQTVGKIHTFSVGFAESEFDESHYARLVTERFGTRHHHIQLAEDEILQNVQEAVTKMDLPTVDAINSYIVVKQVAQSGYKVVLSGLGGDELFGGYPQFRDLQIFKYLAYAPRFLTELMIRTGKARHFLRDIPAQPNTALFDLWWRRIWGSHILADCQLPVPPLLLDETPVALDDFGRITWAELSHYMRDILLRDSDAMSMAVSLEMRVPFLDHELVEFVLQLPQKIKQSKIETKPLLVESCRDILPPEVYQRKKMGFELPMDRWMRGPLKGFMEQGLGQAIASGLIQEEGVRQLQKRFVQGRAHWQVLWSLVVVGCYLARPENRSFFQRFPALGEVIPMAASKIVGG